MIKIHCNQLSDFIKIYLLDWPVLVILLIPLIFCLFFPVYWFYLLPAIWKSNYDLYRPRSWLIGYFLLATIIWIVFLMICFMRNGRRLTALAMTNSSPNCLSKKSVSSSTEDLWAEDAYLPEQCMISNSTGFRVSLSTVHQQPDIADLKYPSRPKISAVSPDGVHMTVPVKQQRRSCSEEDYLLEPPNDFRNPMGSEAGDDIDHFNSILTSLQGLADSISADFDQLDANDHLVDVNKIE